VPQPMTNGSNKHYSSRKSRIETNPSRSSTHKALPSAPDPRRKSRPSEDTWPRGNQETSGSTQSSSRRPNSKGSPHGSSGLMPVGLTHEGDFYARPFSPGSTSSRGATPSSTNSLPQQMSREKLPGPRKTLTKRTHPIELPADVPLSALLQVPLSKGNRQSMNLEPKSPDPSEYRVSRKLSNKVLASLLKSPLSTRLSRMPQSVTSGKTNESYTTAFDSPSGHTAEYFSAADVRRTILVEEEADATDGSNGDENAIRGLGIQTSRIGSPPTSQRSTLVNAAKATKPSNRTFTSHPPERRLVASPLASHPPDMGMISSPHAKQESFPTRSAASSVKKASTPGHSRFPSLTASSLGEPGPEIDDSEPFDLATLMQGNEHTRSTTASSIPLVVSVEPPVQETQHEPDAHADVMSSTITDVTDLGLPQSIPTASAETPQPLVAELEGAALVPAIASPAAQEEKPSGPVELEAPVQHTFSLPPRSSAVAQEKGDKGGMTSATIATQSDFFKMPPPVVEGESYPSKALSATAAGKRNHASMPLKGRQAPLTSVEEGRASAPPTMLARSIPRKPAKPIASQLGRLQSAEIIEQLSSTPPGSPIHTRSPSEMSANSAQRLSARISVSSANTHPLAPSLEAPAPPGPGGRQMVSPDFATAGLFEGERKAKRGSRGSTGGQASWKKFFGAANHSPLSGTPGSNSTTTSFFDAKAVNPDVEGVHEQSQGMLDSAGKDVLWFKGMSRDGVWISAATGTN
jgi:hypothetical protein